MIETRARWYFIFAVLVVFGGIPMLGGCGLFEGDDEGGSDGDADGDSDVDGDSDADADGEGSEDSDTVPDLRGLDPCADCAGFTGVDMLVVVDNSISMSEEQKILATGFYTLINALVNPPDEETEVAGDVRLAVTSSDLSLQYGRDGTAAKEESNKIPQCKDRPKGDDGVFINDAVTELEVETGRIKCLEDGDQCPNSDWSCVNGVCVAPEDESSAAVECPDVDEIWLETTEDDPNAIIATQMACLAQLGTKGCGVEQQLQAGIRALTRSDQEVFVRDGKLLAFIVVSDEEDCSIESAGLFETSQWKGDLFNTACNLPESNEEDFLFSIDYFYESLLSLKNGQRNAVVFAGIVGVPTNSDECEGTGDKLDDCLGEADMTLRIEEFTRDGTTFNHFRPACTRDDADGVEVTSARPGRRYVKLAQKFSCNGYIYSICNADWSKAMSEIARLINECTVMVVK